jgi:hypothetical protein
MSSNAIANTADYASVLQQRISDKIKANFIEMIPEEQFDTMMAKAMDALMNGSPVDRSRGHYNILLDINTVPGMIYADLHKRAKDAVVVVMARPEYSDTFGNQEMQNHIETGIAKVVTENADTFMKTLVAGIIRSAMQQTVSTLRNGNNGLSVY